MKGASEKKHETEEKNEIIYIHKKSQENETKIEEKAKNK